MTTQDIIAAFQAMTPAERRRLAQRLQVMGLLETETLATDQRRLAAAPALGAQRAAMARAAAAASAPPRRSEASPLRRNAYQSPVSGRVVLGAPAGDAEGDDPHAMQPLPGQAPNKPIEIIFDGGSRGNPGRGYGSYALRWPSLPEQIVKLQFGDRVTNNEAEYDTLIAALEATLRRLRDADADPATARLVIRGDSLLVINQVQGEWQCKEERLRHRMQRVRELLDQFAQWTLLHHGREKNVEVLGH